MTQRGKSLLVIGLLLACMMVILLVTSQFILLEGFVSIEKERALTNIERAARALQAEASEVDTLAGDYAAWDDAYRFVRDRNEEFVRVSLADAIYPQLRLNLLVFINAEGAIVHSRSFDLQSNEPLPLFSSFFPCIAPGSPLFRYDKTGKGVTGLIMLPEGPLFVASRPVLTSERKGPVLGTLIMGRILDRSEIRRISEALRMPLRIFRLDDPGLSPEILSVRSSLSSAVPYLVRHKNQETISGYALLTDLYRKPALIVMIEMPREIFRKGGETIRYFMLWFLGLSLALLVFSHIFISRFIRTVRKRDETEKRYRMLVEQAAEGIVLAGTQDMRILESNDAFLRLLRYAPGDALPQTMHELAGEASALLDIHVQRSLEQRRPLQFEMSLATKDLSTAFVEVSVAVIAVEGTEVLSFVFHDITERKRIEEQLMYQAGHDALTGLPNRNILLDRLNQSLAFEGRLKRHLAVLLLDIDNFKFVNDSMGHSIGDSLLVSVAERLRASMRKYDTVARFGGDEFVVILTELSNSKEIVPVAEKLLQLFSLPFAVEGREIFVTVSIGIALSPMDGDTADALLKNADMAMYHTKERGKNSFQFFSGEMNRKACERMDLETKLRRALEREEFLLHYQPRAEIATGRIIGAEALIRWQDPEKGLTAPSKIIPLLEETGLIIPVGEWVLRTACNQARELMDEGFPSFQIWVNLSARQFHRQDIVASVARRIEESRLDPQCLGLELTESLLMQDVGANTAKLAALKRMGIRLSIDDFGTGYSSLSYLRRFPLDELKIDQSFIRELTDDPDDAAIVGSIIAMAHSLKLRVVAEGVETPEQLAFLAMHQCEEMQGFYFSKPLPPGLFREFLAGSGRNSLGRSDQSQV